MKPLIYAATRMHRKVQEEERLRKSIKGSLEAINLEYATSVFADYDLVHFINARDLNKISDVKRTGMVAVVSALYCESDKKTKMVDVNSKTLNRTLKSKVRKCLNTADLVLVPGVKAKKFLEKQGVLAEIKVFPTPINFERYTMKNEMEKHLFSRYFSERDNATYILCIGDYSNKIEMDNLLEVAELCHFAKFYFIGTNHSLLNASKYIKTAPKNIVFTTDIEDDVYRSALVNAKILLVLDPYKIESTNVYEAMAAKTQVVAYAHNKDEASYLVDGDNAYIRDGIYELVDCIEKIIKNRLEPTTKNAYDYALNYNLVKSGNKLKEYYDFLINKKKELKAL